MTASITPKTRAHVGTRATAPLTAPELDRHVANVRDILAAPALLRAIAQQQITARHAAAGITRDGGAGALVSATAGQPHDIRAARIHLAAIAAAARLLRSGQLDHRG